MSALHHTRTDNGMIQGGARRCRDRRISRTDATNSIKYRPPSVKRFMQGFSVA